MGAENTMNRTESWAHNEERMLGKFDTHKDRLKTRGTKEKLHNLPNELETIAGRTWFGGDNSNTKLIKYFKEQENVESHDRHGLGEIRYILTVSATSTGLRIPGFSLLRFSNAQAGRCNSHHLKEVGVYSNT